MNTRFRRRIAVSAIILALGVVCAALPSAPAARAATNPNPTATWAAWGLSAEFPNQQLRVRFASYVGDSTPKVLASTPLQDITSQCTIHGTLTYAGDYAVFDGATTYIACDLPNWQAQVATLAPHLHVANQQVCDCPPDKGPFWVSADAVLDATPAPNMLFDASQAGFTFSLPSNGAVATTNVQRSSGTFQSPPWTVDAAGKRLLVGQYGRSVDAIVSYFNGLRYLKDPLWKGFFNTNVTGNRMGQWLESPSQSWWSAMPPNTYNMQTGPTTVYIGANRLGGALFHGKLSKLRIDPGCFGS